MYSTQLGTLYNADCFDILIIKYGYDVNFRRNIRVKLYQIKEECNLYVS